MRYTQILREYSHEKTLARFDASLLARIVKDPSAKRQGVVNGEEAIRYFEKVDPTKKKAFVLLMVKWFLDGSMKLLEDAPKLKSAILHYDKFRNKVKDDISKMSFSQFLDLGDALAATQSKQEKRGAEEQGYYDRDEAKLFLENDALKIVIPETEEASVYFGRGTRWCTAADDDNMFDAYRDAALYIIMFKGRPDKWQFYLKAGNLQLMDAKDDSLKGDQVRAEPAVQAAFREIFLKTKGCLPYVVNPPQDYIDSELMYFPSNISYVEHPTQNQVLVAAVKGGDSTIKKLNDRDLIDNATAVKIVGRNGHYLACFSGRQTPEMVASAVKADSYALLVVDSEFLTQELLVSVLKKDPVYLHHFQDKLTDKSVLEIFSGEQITAETFMGLGFRYLKELTLFKLFDRVVDKDSSLITNGKEKFKTLSDPLLSHILTANPYLAAGLMTVRQFSKEMISATLKGDANTIQYFKNLYPWMIEQAISEKSGAIYFIPAEMQTPAIQLLCVQKAIEQKNWSCIADIKNPTPQVQEIAVRANPRFIKRFPNVSKETQEFARQAGFEA